MFELSYYAKVGQHGGFTCRSRKGLAESGVRLRRDPDLLMVEGTQYSYTKHGRTELRTVIYKMTAEYIRHIRSVPAFSDARAAMAYLTAAKKAMRTGKAVTFRYPRAA